MDDICNLLFPTLEKEERLRLGALCFEYENKHLETRPGTLYPGVRETFERLSKKTRLYIVSNCQSGYIELFLEKTGLSDCITDFECPGGTGLGKGPNIRLVMERNHLHAPVYVGDIEGDRTASAEAGIPFCHAAYGFGSVEKADYVIQEFIPLSSPEFLSLSSLVYTN